MTGIQTATRDLRTSTPAKASGSVWSYRYDLQSFPLAAVLAGKVTPNSPFGSAGDPFQSFSSNGKAKSPFGGSSKTANPFGDTSDLYTEAEPMEADDKEWWQNIGLGQVVGVTSLSSCRSICLTLQGLCSSDMAESQALCLTSCMRVRVQRKSVVAVPDGAGVLSAGTGIEFCTGRWIDVCDVLCDIEARGHQPE